MKTKEIKNDLGMISYNLPNIPKRLRLLSKMGLSPSNLDAQMSFEMIANILEEIQDLIVSVHVEIDGEVIKSWNELLERSECMEMVLSLVTSILNPGQENAEQKKSLKRLRA